MPTRAEVKQSIWDSMPHGNKEEKDKARKAITDFFDKSKVEGDDFPDSALRKPKKEAK